MSYLKRNIYEVEKNIERILKGGSTGFLTLNVSREIQGKLKQRDYQVFSPYKGSEKVILFSKKEPKIRLYRIDYYEQDKITHSSILGSLFGLNITSEMFGDIVLYDGNFYFYVLDDIHEYVVNNFTMVGNTAIQLVEISSDFLDNYKREYEEYELIVASLRIDAVIARLIGVNREKVQVKIKEKLVLLNGEVLNKSSYLLREGDIFSIRGFGKFIYFGIKDMTRKNRFVIQIKKYI